MKTTLHSAKTPTLRIGYEQTGDRGDAILLLHGFPYDIREYDAMRDRIAADGRRVIVPYLRGFGTTQYLSGGSFRSGQQAALGKDIIDLLDALEIERATLVGYDWGGRGGCVAAALWPQRVRALVSVDGYAIQDIAKLAATPKPPDQERQLWYQWYFQSERGRQGLEKNRAELSRLLWTLWSPGWHFAEKLFETTAKAFDNPDFVDTVIHSYRHRYANAAGDPALEEYEERLAQKPTISCPTVVVHGADDTVEPPSSSEGQESYFAGRYERRILQGVGHCPPAEAPDALAQAVEDVLRWSAAG